MKTTFFATTAALALAVTAQSASAGNLAEPVVEVAPAPTYVPAPAPVYTGNDWTGFYAGGSVGYASASDDDDTLSSDFDGGTYGIHAGYDYDFGSLVLGGEVEYSGFDLNDSSTDTDVDSMTRVKLRAGYDAGAFLPYLTAGVAQLNTGGGTLGDVDDTGGFYGLGLDYKMTDSIRVGAEVLQHEFDDYADSGVNADVTTAALRMAFEF